MTDALCPTCGHSWDMWHCHPLTIEIAESAGSSRPRRHDRVYCAKKDCLCTLKDGDPSLPHWFRPGVDRRAATVATPSESLTSHAMSATAGSWGSTPQHNAAAVAPTPNNKPKVSLADLANGAYLKAADLPKPGWFLVTDWNMKHFEANAYGPARDALVLTLSYPDGREIEMSMNGTNVGFVRDKTGASEPGELVGTYVMIAAQKVTTRDGLRDGLRVIDCGKEVPR